MRQITYSYFYARSIFIMKNLEVIACSLNKDEIFKIFKDGWDLSVKAKT